MRKLISLQQLIEKAGKTTSTYAIWQSIKMTFSVSTSWMTTWKKILPKPTTSNVKTLPRG
jgi:hypothetical protein